VVAQPSEDIKLSQLLFGAHKYRHFVAILHVGIIDKLLANTITNIIIENHQGVQATPSTHRTRLRMMGGANHRPDLYTTDGVTGLHQQPNSNLHSNSFGDPAMAGYGMRTGAKMGSQRPLPRTGSRRTNGPPNLPIR
jgi:hypothetical protein